MARIVSMTEAEYLFIAKILEKDGVQLPFMAVGSPQYDEEFIVKLFEKFHKCPKHKMRITPTNCTICGKNEHYAKELCHSCYRKESYKLNKEKVV